MKAGRKGHGLQTLQDLKKGQFIIEYVGCGFLVVRPALGGLPLVPPPLAPPAGGAPAHAALRVLSFKPRRAR